MCGIVGYVGDRDIASVLLVGLERLSYRGYDSSGIATISKGELSTWKKAGKVYELQDMLKNLTIRGNIGIGHTRWATHGKASEVNAHPHLSQENKIALVHNGIIENYLPLKKKLMAEGHIFRSETDSEVIVHLVERYFQNTLEDAVEMAFSDLQGTYAFAVICEQDPTKIVVARKGSPLIIGLGKNENFVASDLNAILTHTKDVMYLEDGEMAIVTQEGVTVRKIGGAELEKKVHHISWDAATTDKDGYDHYMLKEIHEQPMTVRKILSKYVDVDNRIAFKDLRMPDSEFSNISRFIIQACGTSWHAGLIGKYLIEKYTSVLTEVDISSEFRYRNKITDGKEIVVAISQSGETADTLACLREAKSKFFRVLSFVNVKGSSIDRESDGVIYSHSGQEVGVASTKNFTSQLMTLYLFALYVGLIKRTIPAQLVREMLDGLRRIPDYIEMLLGQSGAIKEIAEKYYLSRDFLFLGRSINYPSALEGALKLKEISYIHATGYAAGELKHGPIALIDSKLPVVCIAPQCGTYEKMVSNIQEVKARRGKTIVIATEGDTEIQKMADEIIYIPNVHEDLTPLLVAIPLQLLAYYIALRLDCDVDQPRNLAKSVTVE